MKVTVRVKVYHKLLIFSAALQSAVSELAQCRRCIQRGPSVDRGSIFTKVKAHEHAVKLFIDLNVILLEEQNNNRSLWSALNRASPY